MKLIFLALLTAALSVPAARAVPPGITGTNLNSVLTIGNVVVARGRGFEIRRREMDKVLTNVLVNNPGDRLPPDADIHVLNQLIEIQLVLQQATVTERAAGQDLADKKMAGLKKNLRVAEFERRLQASGMTADELRLKFAQEATAQASLARQLGINVTDADVRKYYDDHPVISEQPPLVRIREILLANAAGSSGTPLPASVVEAKHRQIFELYQQVQAGGDMAVLARQYNEDPGSKDHDGELAPFRADQMEFGDLAFALQTNQISGVLTNSDGYRFFQVLKKLPARKIEFSELADKIKKAMIGGQKSRLAPAYLEKLRTKAGVEILDARLKAMIAAESMPPGIGPH